MKFRTLLDTANIALLCTACFLAHNKITMNYDQPAPTIQTAQDTPRKTSTRPTQPVEKARSEIETEQQNPIDARVKQLELSGMTDYNNLVPTILSIADETAVPADILALTVLTETAGKGGTRYEPGFQKKYIDPLFTKDTKGEHGHRLHTILENMHNKQVQDGSVNSKEHFRAQLATSCGPAQIMYQVAVEQGFRGTFEELDEPATNLRYAALRIRAKKRTTRYEWDLVLTDYNTGSVNGTPHPGHLDRGKQYWQRLHPGTQ